MNEQINEEFYLLGKIGFVIGILVLIVWKINPFDIVTRLGGCTFRRVTGLYCPGCGGTRAVRALLACHPIKSIYYNAAVPYFGICYFCFMGRMFLLKHFGIGLKKSMNLPPLLYIGIGILLIQWVIKLILLIGFNIAWLR